MPTRVTTEIDHAVARLKLAAEPAGKPPTLDYDVLDQIEEALDNVQHHLPSVRLLIVESTESKYFVVGADLKALREIDQHSIRPWVERGHEVFRRFENLPIPVVAVVRGYAGGGGLELALACDFIYATDNARFALPEAGLGLVTGWGGSYRLPLRVGDARAKEMMFSGRAVDAVAALNMGLVNYFGSEAEVQEKLEQFTTDVSANSAISIAMEKSLIDAATDMSVERMKFEEAVASTTAMSSTDTARRLNEFFEKRSRKKTE